MFKKAITVFIVFTFLAGNTSTSFAGITHLHQVDKLTHLDLIGKKYSFGKHGCLAWIDLPHESESVPGWVAVKSHTGCMPSGGSVDPVISYVDAKYKRYEKEMVIYKPTKVDWFKGARVKCPNKLLNSYRIHTIHRDLFGGSKTLEAIGEVQCRFSPISTEKYMAIALAATVTILGIVVVVGAAPISIAAQA